MAAIGPEDCVRRVLVMAVGLTPQVVTETIYALAVARRPPWVPTEVLLLTTKEGAVRARLTLLDPDIGQFHRLCEDHGLTGQVRFDDARILAIGAPGPPLHDIRTAAENGQAADAITALVRSLCEDEQAAVHVSIAGGRKTMGFYLGYALSLFGRGQDRLSHVLVNEPFESINDFYYPPRAPRVVFGAGNRPASTADARIELAEIPFVRLRQGLPQELLSGAMSFGDTVAAASRQVGPPRLSFTDKPLAVTAGPTRVRLPPLLWAWHALLADAVQTGAGAAGMVRPDDLSPSRLLGFYARAAGYMSAAWMQLESQLRREGGVPESFFREKNAKLNRCLRERLGPRAAPYLVHSRGRRPLTRCGLLLQPDQVDLPT